MKPYNLSLQKYILLIGILTLGFLCGCVDQKLPVENTKACSEVTNTQNNTLQPRIIATSVTIMQICEKLELPLIGIPQSKLVPTPDCYASATLVGSPMTPDMEIIKSLSPDWVLSPSSLQSDLAPKYENANLSYAFFNLKSIFGLYRCIEDMGKLFSCEEKATALTKEFEEFYISYQQSHKNQKHPTVLILMGLPGSYVVATPKSYVGSLVEMAGGINIYSEEQAEFINVNTEDLLNRNPDIILRTSHAMPDSVMEMFHKEFETNDIWKHFQAVQNNRVYDLSNEYFGMSANFNYQNALTVLDSYFYTD